MEADRLRKELLNNENLQRICVMCGIDRFINLNPSSPIAAKGTMSDTMEAIFGAINEDGGLEALKAVMTSLGLLP